MGTISILDTELCVSNSCGTSCSCMHWIVVEHARSDLIRTYQGMTAVITFVCPNLVQIGGL